MTRPENPDPADADPADPNGVAPSEGIADPEAGAEPGVTSPAVASTDAADAGGIEAVDAGEADSVPLEDEESDATALGADPDVASVSDTTAADPAETVETAAPDGLADATVEGGASNGVASGAGSTPWVNTAAPPWQRAGKPAPSVDQPTVTIRVDPAEQPESDVGHAPEEPRRRVSGAYGFTPGVGPGRSDPSNRYVHPVSQPMRDQSSGTGQDYSQPTVRIGGYGQFDPAASAPAQPSAASRIRSTPRLPRRASLQLRYLEPWSVLKISLVLSVAGFLAWMVAVGILYGVLAGMGVWDQLNGTYSDLTSLNDPQSGQPLISAGGVFGVATLIGLVNIVLITAMCTVGAFIYNVSADLAGGIEVTLSERD